jgi:hypothetical protein
VVHALASAIAWVIAVALVLGLLALLLSLLRVILRDSVGKPRRRALTLSAFAFGLFVLWSLSQVVP